MARPMLQHVSSNLHSVSQLPLAIALFVSVTALVALCARHATRRRSIGADLVPRSKHLAATISSKAITLLQKKGGGGRDHRQGTGVGAKEGDVDGGLWQKAILMGEKCQPLEFSGVIYYDYSGNQLAEPPVPRSPRATPLHALSLPAAAR